MCAGVECLRDGFSIELFSSPLQYLQIQLTHARQAAPTF